MGNFLSIEEEEPEIEFTWDCSNNEESNEDEEPFDFSQLPQDLQFKVVDMLGYKEFSVLDRTSRLGNSICWEKTYSLPYDISQIYVNKKTTKCLLFQNYGWYDDCKLVPFHVAAQQPARILPFNITIKSRISSGRMQAVAKLFEKNGTKTDTLALEQHITFKPEDLGRLIKAIKPRAFRSTQFVPQEFFEVPAVQNLEYISLALCGITDDELLKVKNEFFYVENEFVTARGLNRFLKQWKKGKNEIRGMIITFDTSYGTRNFETILDGLDANPIWTPALHEQSLVGKIKIEEFSAMSTGDPEHIYSLCRSDNIEETRIIKLTNERFEIMYATDEAAYIMGYLTDDQHYVATGECFYCREEFCEHRKRYSMPRLKKFFPRVHYSILLTFKGMMLNFGALRIEKVLLGERPFTRPPIFEYSNRQQESRLSRFLSHLRVLFFDHV